MDEIGYLSIRPIPKPAYISQQNQAFELFKPNSANRPFGKRAGAQNSPWQISGMYPETSYLGSLQR
jgi:hypothetical protein